MQAYESGKPCYPGASCRSGMSCSHARHPAWARHVILANQLSKPCRLASNVNCASISVWPIQQGKARQPGDTPLKRQERRSSPVRLGNPCQARKQYHPWPPCQPGTPGPSRKPCKLASNVNCATHAVWICQTTLTSPASRQVMPTAYAPPSCHALPTCRVISNRGALPTCRVISNRRALPTCHGMSIRHALPPGKSHHLDKPCHPGTPGPPCKPCQPSQPILPWHANQPSHTPRIFPA